MKHSALERMKQGSALKKGISVEKEHKDLYNELKKRLKEQGVIMPITEEQFYAKIAKAHLKERKDYYDLLEKYVEKYGNKKKMHKGGDFDLHSTTTNYDNLQPGDKVFTILGPYANGNKYYGIVDIVRPTELYITFYDAKTDKKVSGSEQMVYDYTVPYYKHIKDMKKNGGIVEEKNLKVGMRGVDYGGESGKIIAIAKAKDFDKIKKYDNSGAMEEGVNEGEEYGIDDNTTLVAVKLDRSDETAVYVYDYDGFYVKNKDIKKNGGDLKQRMFDAGYVKKPDFISEEVSISALPYKKSFFDRFTHEYETLNGFSEDQWREYAHYLKKKDLALRYDQPEDAYIITNPHGEGKFYGTSQYATFENGGLVDAMRNNIPKLQAALDNPTLSETAKKNIKERLDYLNKVVTGYDAFREQRSKIKPTPAPAESQTEIKEEVVTVEGRVDSAPVSIESAPKTGEQKYYIIVELDVKQKVKDALWYRNISYTTVRQPGGANMLIVEGKDNLDIAYEVYSKYREKLGHGGKRKESVTGIYDPSQHRMVAEDGMMIGSQPFRYYWRYKTTLAKDKGMYVKSKFFRTQEEAKKFVSDHKDIITNAFMYDVLQNRKLVLTYKKGVFEIGDMKERAKEGKQLKKADIVIKEEKDGFAITSQTAKGTEWMEDAGYDQGDKIPTQQLADHVKTMIYEDGLSVREVEKEKKMATGGVTDFHKASHYASFISGMQKELDNTVEELNSYLNAADKNLYTEHAKKLFEEKNKLEQAIKEEKDLFKKIHGKKWDNHIKNEVYLNMHKSGNKVKYEGYYKGIYFEGEGKFEKSGKDIYSKIESKFESRSDMTKEDMQKIRQALLEGLKEEGIELRKGGSPKSKFTICPVGTKIQTLIFNKDNFTKKQAKDWAKKHDERYGFVDEKENTYRIRQREPETFVEDSFRTITLTKGVKGVIGCPKK